MIGSLWFFISVGGLSFSQLEGFGRKLSIGDQAQEVRDAVETCPPCIIGLDDVPGGYGRIGGLEHLISGSRVVVPASMRFQVHRAQLPDLPAVGNAVLEATVLLLLADFQPVLDQDDALPGDETLNARGMLQEFLVLLVGIAEWKTWTFSC